MANIYSEYGIGMYDDPYSNMSAPDPYPYTYPSYDDPYSNMRMQNYAGAINSMYGYGQSPQVAKPAGSKGTKGGSKFGPGKEQSRVMQFGGGPQSMPALMESGGSNFQKLSPTIGQDMDYTRDLVTFLDLLRQLGPLLYG